MSKFFKKVWRVSIDTLQTDCHDIAFEITKTKKRQPNTASLTIWNLSEPQRRQIEALSIPTKTAAGKATHGRGKIRVQIEAGYEGNTSLLFRGDLRTAITTREGPDLVTTIEGDDGGRDVLLARVSRSYAAGTPVKTAVRDLASALGVGTGNLEALTYTTRGGGTFSNGTVLSGKADEQLTRLLHSCQLTWSIQNGALQILEAGKGLSTSAVLLSPSTGLVGTPSVSPEGYISFVALLVPGVFPGSRVKIQCPTLTTTATVVNVTHTGDSSVAGPPWYHVGECRAD